MLTPTSQLRQLNLFHRQRVFAMNIQNSHTWRSTSRPKVRGVAIGKHYYRIDFIGSPDLWKIEQIPAQGESVTRYFTSRRDAQEFLQSVR